MPKPKKSKPKSTKKRTPKPLAKRSVNARAASKRKPRLAAKAKRPPARVKKKAVVAKKKATKAKAVAPKKKATKAKTKTIVAAKKKTTTKAVVAKKKPVARRAELRAPAPPVKPAPPVVAAPSKPIPAPAPRGVPRPSNVTPSSPHTLIGVKKIVPAAAASAPAELQRPKTLPPPTTTVQRTPKRSAPNTLALHRADECVRRHGLGTPDPELRRAIAAALGGDDALLVTSEQDAVFGVTLAAAEQIQQPTLFVSPIAAVLRAFGDRFSERSLPVFRIDATVAAPERARLLSRMEKAGSCLVLLSPAELRAADVVRALGRSLVGLCVIDEAHAVSSFSHELRPSMSGLAASLTALGNPPVLCATRPVPAAVRHDIVDRLVLRRPLICELGLSADNVVLSSYVARGEVRQAQLLSLLQRLPPPGIIFCALPHDVDAVYAGLAALRLGAHRYHSGLAPAERARELEAFCAAGRRAIMVATSGFATPSGVLGLGDDGDPALSGFGRTRLRPDVRFVIHYQAPPSLEQYAREIALAGGDGERSDAVLLYESAHRSLNDALLAQQRFRPQHLLDLSRALEAAAVEGKPLTIEALALTSGQSRRTMDRLTSLVADAGLVEKVAGWVKPTVNAATLSEGCRKLGAELGDLRSRDARRLDAVSEYSESSGCRSVALSRYFGLDQPRCGQCSSCAPAPASTFEPSSSVPTRRPAVQTFSVSMPGQPELPQRNERFGAPLTATLADIAGRS